MAGLSAEPIAVAATLDAGVLEGIPVGIFAVDRGWKVTLWNRAIAEWTGVPAGRALGRRASELLPPLAEDRYRARLDPLMQGGPPVVFSYQLHAGLFPETPGRGPRRARYCTASALPGGKGLLFAVEDRTEVAALVREARAEVRRRKEAEARLNAALAAKEMLIREASHRVKNNLSMIVSLIRMESDRAESEGELSFLEGLEARIRSIALLHELLYKGEMGAEIALDHYLGTLCESIVETFGPAKGDPRMEEGDRGTKVMLETFLEPAALDRDATLYMGMIAAELITNSLKYASRPGRAMRLAVALRVDAVARRLELLVEDDGPGFPVSPLIGPSGAPGSGSLGWQLVRMLSSELQGSAEALPGPGARVAIRIPYEREA